MASLPPKTQQNVRGAAETGGTGLGTAIVTARDHLLLGAGALDAAAQHQAPVNAELAQMAAASAAAAEELLAAAIRAGVLSLSPPNSGPATDVPSSSAAPLPASLAVVLGEVQALAKRRAIRLPGLVQAAEAAALGASALASAVGLEAQSGGRRLSDSHLPELAAAAADRLGREALNFRFFREHLLPALETTQDVGRAWTLATEGLNTPRASDSLQAWAEVTAALGGRTPELVPEGVEFAGAAPVAEALEPGAAELRAQVEALGWRLEGREGTHWLAVRRFGEDARAAAELRVEEGPALLEAITTVNETAAEWLTLAQDAEGEASAYIRKRAEALGWELEDYDGGAWCAVNPDTGVRVRHPDGLILLELLKATKRGEEGLRHE